MKDIKMVVTDMDGTLLNSNHEVSHRFFEVFKHLKTKIYYLLQQAVDPIIVLRQSFKTIKEHITIVAENGGLVIQNDKLLLSNTLSHQKLSELFYLVNSIENAHPLFCTRHKAYIKRTSDELINLFSEYYSNYTIIDSIEDIKDDVIKIALYHTTNSETNIYPFVKHLSNEYNVVVSGNHWVDISDAITNKGHAIEFLQKHHNINPSETMAFGDYNNDFEMLQCATHSYAMANAHVKIKAIAKYQTKSNDEFGVEHILEQLVAKKQ